MKRKTQNTPSGVKGRAKRVSGDRRVRFGFVGVINTGVDFLVLNLLVGFFGVPIVIANMASTTAAMLTSFSLNKKIVFGGNNASARKQFILFLIVTLSAIWLVQSSVIFAVFHAFESTTNFSEVITLNIAKLAGISAGLVWNYIGYSRFVFRDR